MPKSCTSSGYRRVHFNTFLIRGATIQEELIRSTEEEQKPWCFYFETLKSVVKYSLAQIRSQTFICLIAKRE